MITTSRVQPREPLLVYIEANPLMYWMLPTSHDPNLQSQQSRLRLVQEAKDLFAVFNRHQGATDPIWVITSQWALTESHSILYQDALWARGINYGRSSGSNDPRRLFPPDKVCLQNASQTLDSQVRRVLDKHVTLVIDAPDQRIWPIALRLAEECGIYAPDCLHLATALYAGCNLFVTQDIGFIKAIHYHRTNVIENILTDLFVPIAPPTFEACPLVSNRRLQQGTPTAREYLDSIDYT